MPAAEEGQRRDARRHPGRAPVDGGRARACPPRPSYDQPPCEGAPGRGVAHRHQRAQVGRMPTVGPPDLPEREVPAERHPVVQRGGVGHDLEPLRQL